MGEILGWGVFLIVLLMGSQLLEYNKCHARYDASYAPVTYGVLQGCMATFNDKHIPVERIREVE